RQEVSEGCLQVESSALEEEHCDCSRGDDLSQTGDVECGVWLNQWGVALVGEVAQSIRNEEFAVGQDSECAAGERACLDGALEDFVNSFESTGIRGDSRAIRRGS